MRLCAPYLLSVLVIFGASLCNAIFADEAYQIDFHHALLGVPQAGTTFFHRPSPSSKASLLYTLSERQVLGAVNPKDGTLVWRQQLQRTAQNETNQGFLKAGETGDTMTTAIGRNIQTWDATNGRLVWEYQGLGEVHGLEISQQNGDVLAVNEGLGSGTQVQRLAAESGRVLWSYTDTR